MNQQKVIDDIFSKQTKANRNPSPNQRPLMPSFVSKGMEESPNPSLSITMSGYVNEKTKTTVGIMKKKEKESNASLIQQKSKRR